MSLLGMKVTDKVTGFKGVVTAISFDLFGCIQAIVTPAVSEGSKQEDSRWYDVSRLKVESKKVVMEIPNYEYGYVAEGKMGSMDKPRGKW